MHQFIMYQARMLGKYRKSSCSVDTNIFLYVLINLIVVFIKVLDEFEKQAYTISSEGDVKQTPYHHNDQLEEEDK